jgi:ribosomal protein S18 acetylase RimI-like enzyme
MNYQLQDLSKNEITNSDIEDINSLIKQLSPNTTVCIQVGDVLQILKNAVIVVMRDLDVVRGGDGRIVGMTTLVKKHQLMGFFGFIEDVVVDKDYHRQGIAEKMNLYLIDIARNLGMKHLDLTSNPTRTAGNSLYDKLGYVVRDTFVRRLVISGK